MLSRIVALSIRARLFVLGLLVCVIAGGIVAARALPVDAVPDVSTIQVAVLTDAPGLSPVEVEQAITFPIETALNGVPSLVELRSVSRSGLSAVTVVFRDDTDVWFARQLILERLREVEDNLPPGASRPQLGPVSSGLGEIYWFVVRSNHHGPSQLRTILDWEIVPKLRGVPGVVELNTMGGDLKQYEVVVDRARLHAQKVSLSDVRKALESANRNAGGGYIDRGDESFTIRGTGLLSNEEEIGNVVIRTSGDGTATLVRHIGSVRVGAALRHGALTRDGEGEAVCGIVMMLLGANSRDVVAAVKAKVAEVQATLPPGVIIDPIYDRADFVSRTLATVLRNLIEGALIVTIVLALFLGTIRGAVAVVLGIPVSMSIALFGMHAFGVTGDLMSLGAIDFGFLVDGPIVILEAVIAAMAGRKLASQDEKLRAYAEVCAAVVRPVVFSVAIIMLVYLPLFTLQGIEGKMFRPMALTMACALLGAVIYSLFFFPALVAIMVPPPKDHGPKWIGALGRAYRRVLPRALHARLPLLAGAAVALVVSVFLLLRAGADFVPRIAEGDVVVTIRRAPSISLAEARRLDLETEKVLMKFPEAITAVGMTGRAEIAYDPVGNDNTDMLVRLRPPEEWTTAKDLDGLSEVIKESVEKAVPGTFVSVSQPIEDRTNELISGSRADVAIQLYGPDLEVLRQSSEQVGAVVKAIQGTGDVRVERILGLPTITVTPDRQRLARYGVRVDDVFDAVEAARIGLSVGTVFEGNRRFGLRMLVPPRAPSAEGLGELFVEAADGSMVPLSEVASVVESDGPAQVRREGLTRTVRVEVNLRGRDLVSWVNEARSKVTEKVQLPSGYTITWGGQFENFERAQARLALVVPLALAIIFAMLLWMFQDLRLATAVFLTVPFALTGGILGLVVRGLSFSIPAAVGFIALAGVSVLNGVVIASETRRALAAGNSLDHAILHGAGETLRAVLTTATVAALGFLPMAISTSAGSEVQRPLATVVIFGILLSTVLTLFVFPGLLRVLVRQPRVPTP